MSTELHPDVFERPYYVIDNPTMYTRDEVRAARFAAFWNPDHYQDMKSKQIVDIDIAKIKEDDNGYIQDK